MSAPTTLLTNGAGTITATGEANGFLIPINPTLANPTMTLGVHGTFTSVVLAIRGQIISGGSYYPVPVLNQTNTSNPSNSGSISLTNSTAVAFKVAVAGYDNIEVYTVSGTPTSLGIEAVVNTGNDGAPVTVAVNTAGAGSFTNITASGTAAITGDLTESGNAAVGGTLTVTGAQTFTGDTTMSGNATVGGTFGTTGLLTAATLKTTGATNHAADVTYTGGSDLNFSGNTGESWVRFTDNLAAALQIGEATNPYMTFVSTNGSEAVNLGKPQRLPTPTTVAATTGGVIGNANAVTEGFTLVTGANNAGSAVKLPPTVAGAVCTIKSNTSGATLSVFPPVNSSINAGAANAVYNMANLAQRTFYAYNSTLWLTAPETPT